MSIFQLSPSSFDCIPANPVNVNLGNTWPEFITAAHCQIFGTPPTPDAFTRFNQFSSRTRRIDVILSFCKDADRTCDLSYSDPWANGQAQLLPQCNKKIPRDLGAVMMFFFNCPEPTNCQMDWANSHVYGMNANSEFYNGFYNPSNLGFWTREIQDAVYAGFQFLLPNMYGPDLYLHPERYDLINTALRSVNGALKFGLMDDNWVLGRGYDGPMFANLPDLTNIEESAQQLYISKWKHFFSGIHSQYWYNVSGRPFIKFYNSGKLKPQHLVTPVLRRMMAMFKQDFGVEPYLSLDVAFPPLDVAQSVFMWDTFYTNDNIFVSPISTLGKSIANFMPRWDSKGRDSPGSILLPSDRLSKGPEILLDNLEKTRNFDIVIIETWNDLGEGTGINRNYDYFYQGNWLPPDYFMKITRNAQCH